MVLLLEASRIPRWLCHEDEWTQDTLGWAAARSASKKLARGSARQIPRRGFARGQLAP